MDKIIDFFSFLKSGLKGKNIKTFLIVVLALLLYKMLGVFGIFLGFLFMLGSDICRTTNVKVIYQHFKDKLTMFKSK